MDSLVSTDWLAARLGEADVAIIDASWHLAATGRDAKADYLTEHIPGARFLDLAALNDPHSPVGKTLPGPEQAAVILAALGLSRDQRIVVYDASPLKSSARAWFILRGNGFERLAILDGGFDKWQAEGRPVTSGASEAQASRLLPRPFTGPVIRKDQVIANLGSRAAQVVDARDAGRFTGETVDTVHNLPGGHIPGARNLFYRDLFNADGTLLSDAELRTAFATAGIDLARPIVASCGSGVTASVLLFALHRLGVETAALYDGSWSEWGADPATPKETGPA